MQTFLCWCNACHARRHGENDQRKFDDCPQQQGMDYAAEESAKSNPVAVDAVVEANRKLLLERSNVGVAKYGVTLAGSNLSRRALLQHALEEALDLANYLQAELMRENKTNG